MIRVSITIITESFGERFHVLTSEPILLWINEELHKGRHFDLPPFFLPPKDLLSDFSHCPLRLRLRLSHVFWKNRLVELFVRFYGGMQRSAHYVYGPMPGPLTPFRHKYNTKTLKYLLPSKRNQSLQSHVKYFYLLDLEDQSLALLYLFF